MKILIVDDDAQLRSTIQMVLKLKGYEVLDADNGAVALKLARAALPDLVISDIMMPVMDGAATIRALQKIDPSVKIIASSGLVSNEETLRASGAVVHIGRQTATAEGRIEDSTGKLLAHGSTTCIILGP